MALFFMQSATKADPAMVKFYIPSFVNNGSILTFIRSKWVPLLFVLPIALYIFFRQFEADLTHFIIPFFPDEPDKSFGFYQDFLRLCFNEMLWLSFFLLAAWTLFMYGHFAAAIHSVETHMLASPVIYPVAVICTTLIATLLVGNHTLKSFPNSADEYVYLYQAEALSQAQLTQPAHPLQSFFHFNHLVEKDGVRTGRFPPGWPLLLTLPFILGINPAWVNPLLGLIILLVFYRFTLRYYGQRVATWSLISFAFTAYFVFNAAAYFSHTSCLLFTLAFAYCVHLYGERQAAGYAVLAGIFIGMAMITRYYTALLIFIPVLVAMACQDHWKVLRPLRWMGLGCMPFFLILFWYNYQVTGNGFLPVTTWADDTETLGFVKGHTVLKGLEHVIRRMLLFFYWSSPALLVLYFIYLYKKIRFRTERFILPEDYFMLLLFAGYFFYHHLGGNQYGPRFLFEAYPFLVVFVVNKVLKSRAKWSMSLLVAGIVYAIVKFPAIAEKEHRVVAERLDLYTRVRQAGLSNAVVLISTHTSVIRPMPPRDLTRNGLDYQREIIYAQDLGPKNSELMEYYPDRSFYKYVRDPERAGGELVKLR